jgi:phosphate transport system substrate-binding protein
MHAVTKSVFVCFILGTLAAASILAAPMHIVITVPQGAQGGHALPGLLAEWRQTGAVADAFLLDSAQAKDPAFRSIAVLQFPDPASVELWRHKGKPHLGAGVVTTAVDTLARGETFPRDSSKALFLVAEYEVQAPAGKYQRYVRDYVIPEMEQLRLRKLLTSYFLFAARDRAAAPWHAILLMEYRNSVAFEQRTAAMEQVRNQLAANPEWKAASDGKASIRKERSLTQAAWELLPAPELSDLPPYKPEYHVAGTIRILGSFLKFASAALQEGFLKYQPDAQFATNFSTSSEGSIGGLCTGISDVAPAGDDAKITDMMPFFNVHGYLPLELSVATGDYEKRGALWPGVILVNKENPIAHVTMDELDRIFGSERIGGWDIGGTDAHNILYSAKYARGRETNIRAWGQLGLQGEWAGKEIQTYGYAAPGFAVYFERKLFHWVDKWNGNLREYVEPKQAISGPDGPPVTSERMLEELSRDKYGIGWSAMFHAENYPNLKVLAIAAHAGGPYVEYTPANVANRSYPLVRDAYFYVNREPGRPLEPKVREFMRFILSREGQQIIAHTGFFYPLPAGYLREQLRKLD